MPKQKVVVVKTNIGKIMRYIILKVIPPMTALWLENEIENKQSRNNTGTVNAVKFLFLVSRKTKTAPSKSLTKNNQGSITGQSQTKTALISTRPIKVVQRTAVDATMKLLDLNIKELPLTEEDGEFIDQLIKLLEPFTTATTALCGEKYPTVSLIFNYKKLLTLHVTANDLDSETISRVKAALLGDLQSRLVDPRFRDIQFITDQNRTDALAAIKNRMSTIALQMGLLSNRRKATADDSDQPPQLNILNDEEQSDDNNNYKEQEPAIVVEEDTPEEDSDQEPSSALGRLFDSSAADKGENGSLTNILF
ncbi:hypothetical protein DPMN_038839 [Dreissena polymorpha]|uniref:Uncharacterized protein n=1 Tax=Dreissena polymorpha TaxID=45954 RepID=A0A9D4MDW6_DREPO|nr:hypothetical protein DPMN_038839 [Dreissena polymorpha]